MVPSAIAWVAMSHARLPSKGPSRDINLFTCERNFFGGSFFWASFSSRASSFESTGSIFHWPSSSLTNLGRIMPYCSASSRTLLISSIALMLCSAMFWRRISISTARWTESSIANRQSINLKPKRCSAGNSAQMSSRSGIASWNCPASM